MIEIGPENTAAGNCLEAYGPSRPTPVVTGRGVNGPCSNALVKQCTHGAHEIAISRYWTWRKN